MIPGAVRIGKWKAVWNIREGWRGAASHTAIVPELFDLWQDPQERYDIFMTSWAEKTWQAPQMAERLLSLLPSYQKYPNRPLQTAGISYAMFDVEDAQVQSWAARLEAVVSKDSLGKIGTTASKITNMAIKPYTWSIPDK